MQKNVATNGQKTFKNPQVIFHINNFSQLLVKSDQPSACQDFTPKYSSNSSLAIVASTVIFICYLISIRKVWDKNVLNNISCVGMVCCDSNKCSKYYRSDTCNTTCLHMRPVPFAWRFFLVDSWLEFIRA